MSTATDIHLDNEQREAVELCSDRSKRIVCVTGQAGTGKTTILKEAVTRLSDQLPEYNSFGARSIQLSAPTGRAASRIKEVTNIEAKTVHRMMRFSMPENDEDFGLPAYSKLNPMPFDCIFVDEASMLTPDIRRSLIDAMRKGCCIRFFGDINQLPPIMTDKEKASLTDGVISPFDEDLRKFPSVTLTKNYRSTDGIISVADRVIRNRIPISNDQVRILRAPSLDGTNVVMKLAQEIDFTHPDNQIIAPTNSTKHGTNNINRLIQQRFNKEQDKINIYLPNPHTGETEVRSFKRGDKIVWIKNDYTLDLMNGTIGVVHNFDIDSGSIYIHADGEDREIPSQIEGYNPVTEERYFYDPRKHMMLGYAISTHKAQGSQFKRVCYALSRSRAATRQNVYTAITRAQEQLIIVDIASALSGSLMKQAR